MAETIILGCLLLITVVAVAYQTHRLRKLRADHASLKRSHEELNERFKPVVDADAERQRTLREIEAARIQADAKTAQSKAQLEAERQRLGTEIAHERSQMRSELERERNQANSLIVQAKKQLDTERQRLNEEAAQERSQMRSELERERSQANALIVQARAQLDAERQHLSRDLARLRDEQQSALLSIQKQRAEAGAELQALQSSIEKLRAEFRLLDEESNLQSFGFYKPRYSFSSSEQYQAKLEDILERQKRMLKDKTAAICSTEWTVNGSKSEGKKQINQTLKLMLRAFNGECDATTAKVKYNNIQVMEARIRKAHETINALAEVQTCKITEPYLDLKLQELYLVHEYEEKLQEEKLDQKRIREQMREEEIALREIEKARQEAEKEEQRYEDALRKAREEAERASGAKQQKLQSQIEELQKKLAEAHTNKEKALSRAQMTRAGHVYIISNIGSFGEQVYKIGMTRRLDPMDRVKELGDASVPFEFDVHAIIYTEDAPSLENKLHRAFHHRRVNRVNEKKEFFRLELHEIVDFVRRYHTTEIEIVHHAEAEEYRKTLALIQDEQQRHVAC